MLAQTSTFASNHALWSYALKLSLRALYTTTYVYFWLRWSFRWDQLPHPVTEAAEGEARELLELCWHLLALPAHEAVFEDLRVVEVVQRDLRTARRPLSTQSPRILTKIT